MTISRLFVFSTFLAIFTSLGLSAGCGSSSSADSSGASAGGGKAIELLNVSCDPTRELWRDLNAQFSAEYEKQTGKKVKVKQSHGGSSSQARAVNDGLEADIVSLAMWPDTDLIRRSGLIAPDWEKRSPERSLPYYSTIVFVVRKGNPKGIKDWTDLAQDGIDVVTPDPKTSGNGKLSFLGAWGAVVTRGGSEEEAKKLVTKIYKQASGLDTAARAATIRFSKKNIGDVHLTWENEAQLEVQESNGELEIVVPPVSIRAEPHITWVDENVKRHGTEEEAKAFMEFLYTPAAQATIAKNHYRPNAPGSREQFASQFPEIKLFEVTDFTEGWDDANKRFFDDGAFFDKIFESK